LNWVKISLQKGMAAFQYFNPTPPFLSVNGPIESSHGT